MNQFVEAVAEALYEEWRVHHEPCACGAPPPVWDDLPLFGKELARHQAVAAMAKVREVLKEQNAAGGLAALDAVFDGLPR